MQNPCKISVIIPCFNQGEFLAQSVNSVTSLGRDDIETIVIDDGSTDKLTVTEVDALCARGIKLLRQLNGGVATARNAGVGASSGEYILPLDSDDLLRAGWIDQAIQILNGNPQVGVVYGDAQFFGTKTGRWSSGPFDFERLLLQNYVTASALYRRSVWEQNGGYDSTMPAQGYEDWDFWLGALERGWEFRYIPEVFFDYRKAQESMLTRASGFETQIEAFIANKHAALYRRALLSHMSEKLSITRTARHLCELLFLRVKNKFREFSL